MIEYRDTRDFKAADLEALFLSVEWSSGKFPEKLVVAMKKSDAVISAWDGDTLVGLMSGIDDGIMTAYFHYLLVRPEYQGQGIGAEIVRRMLEHYADFTTKVLIAYNKQVGFYERCGFKRGDDKTPMFVTGIVL